MKKRTINVLEYNSCLQHETVTSSKLAQLAGTAGL